MKSYFKKFFIALGISSLLVFSIIGTSHVIGAGIASYKITGIKEMDNGQVNVAFIYSDGRKETRAFSGTSTKEFVLKNINDSCFKYFQKKAESEKLALTLSHEKNVDRELICPLPVIKMNVEIVKIVTNKVDEMDEQIMTSVGSKEIEIKVQTISQDLEDKSITATLQVGDEVKKVITADYTEKKSFDTFGEKIIIIEAVDCKGQKIKMEKKIILTDIILESK